MTTCEELAAVLAGPRFVPHGRDESGEWGEHVYVSQQLADALADALLASPALARVIREAKAEAWDEGQAGGYICAQGYHAHGDGHGPDSWDCDCPNPYRDQTEEPT